MCCNMAFKMSLPMENESATVDRAEVLLWLHMMELIAVIFEVFGCTEGPITSLDIADVGLPWVVDIGVILESQFRLEGATTLLALVIAH